MVWIRKRLGNFSLKLQVFAPGVAGQTRGTDSPKATATSTQSGNAARIRDAVDGPDDPDPTPHHRAGDHGCSYWTHAAKIGGRSSRHHGRALPAVPPAGGRAPRVGGVSFRR